MLLKSDVETIRKILNAERNWRVRVFSGGQRDRKVGEIDEALVALTRLERQLKADHPAQFPEQLVLFDGEAVEG